MTEPPEQQPTLPAPEQQVPDAEPGKPAPEPGKPSPPLFVILALVVTAILVGMAFLSQLNLKAPDFVLFLGRFHPVFLHLPIGLLVGLFFVEIVNGMLSKADLRPAARTLLWLACLSAVGTSLLGSLLAIGASYNEDTLFRHRWLGVLVAVLTVWMLTLRVQARSRKAKKTPLLYYLLLVVAVVALGPAGHYGGTLTHGKGFLTRYMPDSIRGVFGIEPNPVSEPIEVPEIEIPTGKAPSTGPEEPDAGVPVDAASLEPVEPVDESPSPVMDPIESSAFELHVEPILIQYCGACHGEEKQKGGLRVDSLEALLAGGDGGPVVTPDSPDESSLVRRIILPVEHDDHMPPDGRPQPNTNDVAVLRWWIAAGASADTKADEGLRGILTGADGLDQ